MLWFNNHGSMNDSPNFRPFDPAHPFELGERCEFSGLLIRMLDELATLFEKHEPEWLNAVASQVFALMWGNSSALPQFPHRPTVKRPDIDSPSIAGESGTVYALAQLESVIDWDRMSPPSSRWERFALLALIRLRDCLQLLEKDGPAPSAATLNGAGTIALEAMQSLQLSLALQTDATLKRVRARHAATARHEVFQRLKVEAVSLANSQPFTTKEQALDYITSNLTTDKEGKKFISRGAAAKWLREEGWTPKRKKAE